LYFLLAGLPGGLKWIGTSMIFSAILVFGGMSIAGVILNRIISESLVVDPNLVQTLNLDPIDLILAAKNIITTLLSNISIMYGASGLAMLAAGIVINRKQRIRSKTPPA